MSRDLRYERLVAARPERVFDAFTSSEGQRELYGKDDPGWIVESRCDLRVGSEWAVASDLRPTRCTTTVTCSRRSTGPAGSR